MRYEKDTCAGCGRMFEENDDIVVCPECGTPQHRACYENKNECVNAALHGTDFLWKGNASEPEAEEKTGEREEKLVCPTCGHENPQGATACEACGQKFTFFGVNILEKELELAKIDEEKAAGEQAGSHRSEQNRNDASHEQPESDIERMLNARARVIAPGLTKEQEQERLCSQPIKRVLVFVSSNPLCYVNKFRKMEAGKRTWNWAAFFFTPYWFFYRKLYKVGLVFLSLHVTLSVVAVPFVTKANEAMQSFMAAVQNNPDMAQAEIQALMQSFLASVAPVYLHLGAMFLISVVSALIADKLYKKYVTEKLGFAERITEPISFSQYFLKFSSVNVFLTGLAIFLGNMLPGIIIQMFA